MIKSLRCILFMLLVFLSNKKALLVETFYVNISISKAMFSYFYFYVGYNNFHYYLACTVMVQILGFLLSGIIASYIISY